MLKYFLLHLLYSYIYDIGINTSEKEKLEGLEERMDWCWESRATEAADAAS